VDVKRGIWAPDLQLSIAWTRLVHGNISRISPRMLIERLFVSTEVRPTVGNPEVGLCPASEVNDGPGHNTPTPSLYIVLAIVIQLPGVPMTNGCPPLFILCAPRSFTSLLAAMLGQHPEAYGVPELNLFVEDTLQEMVGAMTDVYAIQLHGLLRNVAELYAGEQTIDAIDMAHRWIVKRIDMTTGEIYKELCRRVAPLRIVDKSPANSATLRRLERISQAFPDACYLHLIRHPFDMSKSLMNLQGGQIMATLTNSIDHSQGYEVLDPQILWYRLNRTVCDFLATVSDRQQMKLRGEDLLNDPKQYLQLICQWLGWSWHDSAYEAMLHPDDSVYARFGPFGAQLGNDPNFLKSPIFKQRHVSTGSLLGALPWRPDNQGFFPHVIELANSFGYE